MRILPVVLVCGLAACVPAPSAEVTKGNPDRAAIGASLPPLQGFSAPVAAHAARSNAEIAGDFLDLSFRMESGRQLHSFSRFEGPVTVRMTGDIPATAGADLSLVLARLRSEAGIDISMASGGSASVTVEFVPRAQMHRVVPTAACFVVPRVTSFAEYKARRNTPDVDWTTLTRREQVAIFVPSDTSPQEVRDCLHEETAQALGPLNDLYRLPDSVFNDDNFHTVLTGFDMLILRAYYDPALQVGMNEAEVGKRLPAILARLNPAGGGVGGVAAGRATPRPWITAVEQAFGPRGTPASRAAAADRMLTIAAAQGWTDGRLAFSHFAVGRLNVTRDPERALKGFTEAGRIYRNLPGAQIHAAHVDMQLAAFALSSGRNDEAVQLADRALPAIRRAQNAALLATVLMIKSEAHSNLGQPAEARAARLDSLGWARYGFGSEQQVRARMSEVTALAARGRRT